MSAQIIDGKAIAAEIRQEIKSTVSEMLSVGRRPPGLAVVLVGEDPASQVYVRNKERSCEEVGFLSELHRLPADVSERALLKLIDVLNNHALQTALQNYQLPAGNCHYSAPLNLKVNSI